MAHSCAGRVLTQSGISAARAFCSSHGQLPISLQVNALWKMTCTWASEHLVEAQTSPQPCRACIYVVRNLNACTHLPQAHVQSTPTIPSKEQARFGGAVRGASEGASDNALKSWRDSEAPEAPSKGASEGASDNSLISGHVSEAPEAPRVSAFQILKYGTPSRLRLSPAAGRPPRL